MPKATIAVIEGIARGGGSELALSFDMRFAAIGRAILAQPEVAVGIIPGGSGTQRLHRLVGRGRALEIVLGCDDIDAETAAQWGYVNRALPDAELRPFVDALARAHRFVPGRGDRARRKRRSTPRFPTRPTVSSPRTSCSARVSATPKRIRRMSAFIDAGGQTRDVERLGFPT